MEGGVGVEEFVPEKSNYFSLSWQGLDSMRPGWDGNVPPLPDVRPLLSLLMPGTCWHSVIELATNPIWVLSSYWAAVSRRRRESYACALANNHPFLFDRWTPLSPWPAVDIPGG